MGGCNVNLYCNPLNSVEYYDPAAKTWAAAAAMGTARFYFAAATLGNVVYVTGNSGGSTSAAGLGAAWHECHATAPGGCTVCAACCKSDIADGGACEACFEGTCHDTLGPTPAPSPLPTSK